MSGEYSVGEAAGFFRKRVNNPPSEEKLKKKDVYQRNFLCRGSRASAVIMEVETKKPRKLAAPFELSQLESLIFKTILDASKSSHGTLRVAGGWVRDKLMGRTSDDIDIALENVSGIEFANVVNEYLQSTGQESHRVALIKANPEQSKHLETANAKVHGVSVDFVNLRSEEYAEDSRIPSMKFGTPLEDAFRRDFTINSLFFNINTMEVEDFTGMGLDDLQLGLIRTPLPAIVTFNDDPLRVVRAVRFSSRYAFALEESVIAAARDATIKKALNEKISRERLLKEVDGMIIGKQAKPVCELSIYIIKLQ